MKLPVSTLLTLNTNLRLPNTFNPKVPISLSKENFSFLSSKTVLESLWSGTVSVPSISSPGFVLQKRTVHRMSRRSLLAPLL